MRILRNAADFPYCRSVVALGMFDGVHIGHQALIRRAVELAKNMDAHSIVSTFDRHPLSVLSPEHAPAPLLTLEENIRKFEALGAEYVYIQPFTPAFAKILPEDYVEFLVGQLHAKAIISGENYTFGREGRGNAELLKALAPKYGYRACIVPSITENGRVMSSTYIRSLRERGENEHAERLLRL